jgi:hypothetical protein
MYTIIKPIDLTGRSLPKEERPKRPTRRRRKEEAPKQPTNGLE